MHGEVQHLELVRPAQGSPHRLRPSLALQLVAEVVNEEPDDDPADARKRACAQDPVDDLLRQPLLDGLGRLVDRQVVERNRLQNPRPVR